MGHIVKYNLYDLYYQSTLKLKEAVPQTAASVTFDPKSGTVDKCRPN